MDIEWRNYIKDEDFHDNTLKNYIINLCEESENLINFLANYYGSILPNPSILIRTSSSENAWQVSNKIIVPEGLIIYLKSQDHKLISQEIKNFRPSKLTFLWIIAHEFMHYGSNHIKVKTIFEPYKDKYLLWLLECEADGLSTAAIIRYLIQAKQINPDSENKFNVKREILSSLFLPIRNKMDFNSNEDSLTLRHPLWEFRLYAIIGKLAWTDNYNLIHGRPKFDKNAVHEKDLLLKHLKELETTYLVENSQQKKNLYDYTFTQFTKDFIEIADRQDKFLHILKENSMLKKNIY